MSVGIVLIVVALLVGVGWAIRKSKRPVSQKTLLGDKAEENAK